MDPTLQHPLIVMVMTTLTFAVVPWLIAQLTTRWQPRLIRNQGDRWAFRGITGGIALAATQLEMPRGSTGLFWFLAVVAAVVLDVQWYRYSRTEGGRNQIEEARIIRAREKELKS